MATPDRKIGIVGRGPEAGALADHLATLAGHSVVGWADDPSDADVGPMPAARRFADHSELIRQASPDVLLILTPHPGHYRPAMDALQAGCHVFLDRPFTAGVQEAVDVVGLARAHGLMVGIGGTIRLLPSIVAARRILGRGDLGPVRLITLTATSDLAAAGIDALLWTIGRPALEVAALRDGPGGDAPVTVASVRLEGDLLATVAVSDAGPSGRIEIVYRGDSGRLIATDRDLVEELGVGGPRRVDLPMPVEGEATPAGRGASLVGNFLAAVVSGEEPCCPAGGAVDTVRLLEAISRSAAIGQFVRLA